MACVGFAMAGALSSPAALAKPTTRLVSCGAQDCLLVTGRRPDAATPVRINGHAVDVTGGRRWRLRLPLDTVRRWSARRARAISIAYDGADADADAGDAELPIGLLGHPIDLASLTISVH